jgi:hypothetical protein
MAFSGPALGLQYQRFTNAPPPELDIYNDILYVGEIVPIFAENDLPGELSIDGGKEYRFINVIQIIV